MKDKTILIIDDTPRNVKLARVVLEKIGVNIIEAGNAELGIELAGKRLPDLILMDIQLPGMNGMEAAAILKKNKKTGNIPIVAMTSLAMSGDMEEIMAVGCDAYISKPFHIGELVEVVNLFLGKSQAV